MADFRWLIEAPGPRYLGVRRLTVAMSDEFEWTADHNKALAFSSQEQAGSMMMALRQMDRTYCKGALFAFEATLGNARPVEHGWMDAKDADAKHFGERVDEMLDRAAERINAAR